MNFYVQFVIDAVFKWAKSQMVVILCTESRMDVVLSTHSEVGVMVFYCSLVIVLYLIINMVEIRRNLFPVCDNNMGHCSLVEIPQ